ncbi:putative phiE125 gp8 family phage protein [Rhodopseudomonas rhenobacensis]|uniref:Putative phiE125 gp8 family phage protein n=1 Tax=Rhodopseudomonas rhenobacensis TaxID=87461 RepID=A0A7W8E0E6_9BRAD|nr:head-tail connector protein [Rhodopseudomonas rhenobacensis]MBB5047826.1 putative phiE125 gp8 family phage protein [Rhodopseudomonas rhenobacensis]
MAAILLVGPASEPWTLAEAKSFLRVEHDADDAVITALIAAARGQIEALTRRALLLQSWRLVLDHWPAEGRVDVRIAPLRAVTAARVFDGAGVSHPVDPAGFVVDAAANVIAAPCWSLPPPGRAHAGIELDLQLGFGAQAADVPDVLRHAIRTLVVHWYENRGLVAIGQSVAMLPSSVVAMIASYRVLSL